MFNVKLLYDEQSVSKPLVLEWLGERWEVRKISNIRDNVQDSLFTPKKQVQEILFSQQFHFSVMFSVMLMNFWMVCLI